MRKVSKPNKLRKTEFVTDWKAKRYHSDERNYSVIVGIMDVKIFLALDLQLRMLYVYFQNNSIFTAA